MFKFINNLFGKNKETPKLTPKEIQIDEENKDFLALTIKPNSDAVIPKNITENIQDVLKLGNEALAQGNLEVAESNYRKAISMNGESLASRINLAWVLTIKTPTQVNYLEEAKEHLLKALEIDKKHIDVSFILSQVYEKLNDIDNALNGYILTLTLKPDFEVARNALYMLAIKNKKFSIVIDFIEQELLKNPKNNQLYFDLGNFYKEVDNYSSAIENYEKYLTYNNKSSETYNNLGAVYFKAKNPELAIENYKKAIDLGELDLKIDSTNQLLFTMNYIPGVSLSDYHDEAIKYGKLLTQKYEQFNSWKDKEERIKVGFLSGDIKYHPVAYFLTNLVKKYSKDKYEFIIYSTSLTEDEMSNNIRKFVSQWKRINIQDPIECAREIHEDGINILIDLAGHSHGHFAKNLHVFSMKPAPVQVTWLGYFNSTGLEQMDYIILDKYSLLEEEYKYMTEEVINLPETRLNYHPPEDNVQYPTIAPIIKNGFITFGCYQSLLKINKEVLSTWSEILNQVPNSKLRIQEKSLSNEFIRNEFIKELKVYGLEDKVILVEGVDHKEYLNSYAEVDIILDTFPFTGGTTTCEALWMGIPTLTMSGNTIIARQTASLLKELKLFEWITENKEEYIQKAISLSQETDKINDIRSTLRQKLLESFICDTKNFSLDFEELLEEMWSQRKV